MATNERAVKYPNLNPEIYAKYLEMAPISGTGYIGTLISSAKEKFAQKGVAAPENIMYLLDVSQGLIATLEDITSDPNSDFEFKDLKSYLGGCDDKTKHFLRFCLATRLEVDKLFTPLETRVDVIPHIATLNTLLA